MQESARRTLILVLLACNTLLIRGGGNEKGSDAIKEEDADEYFSQKSACNKDRLNLFETRIKWLMERPENKHTQAYLMDVPQKFIVDRNICYTPGPDNKYLVYLEKPDIYQYEHHIHAELDDIENLLSELMRRQHNEYYLQNLGWNLMTPYAWYSSNAYMKDRTNISGLLQEMANMYIVFRNYMPLVTERIENICEEMIHNLEVMAHSIEVRGKKYNTHAAVHTVLFKGTGLLIEKLSLAVSWVFTGIYALFKAFDAARLIRKTMSGYIPPDTSNPYAHIEHNWFGLSWVWVKDLVFDKHILKVFNWWSKIIRSKAYSIKLGDYVL